MDVTSGHLLLFTSSLLTCAWCATAANRCADCGTTPVPYPLSTAPNCGDQSYKLRCSANATLFFDTLNNTYPITSISPSTQRLTIQPSAFLPNTCVIADFSTQGIQLNSSLPFNITSSSTIPYLNCSNLLLSSPLNFSSTSLCHTYANDSSDAAACENAPICSTFSGMSYMIGLRDSGCQPYWSFVNLDYSLPVSRWGQPDVELQRVSPPEPVCGTQADCDSESTCGPDPASNSGVRRCFCNSGFHWDAIAGLCAERRRVKQEGSYWDLDPFHYSFLSILFNTVLDE